MNKYSIMVCNAYFLKDKILVNDFNQKRSDLLTYMYEFIVVVCSFLNMCTIWIYFRNMYIILFNRSVNLFLKNVLLINVFLTFTEILTNTLRVLVYETFLKN